MSTAKTNANIQTTKTKEDTGAYAVLDKNNVKSQRNILSRHGNFIDNLQTVQGTALLSDLLPNTSARPGFRRQDYDAFRPDEAIPVKFPDIILACQAVYKSTGIVKTMIDLMTDFSCDGLGFLHKNKKEEDFYNAWSKKINLQRAVHDFVLKLLRDGNVIVRRHTARLNRKQEKEMLKVLAKPDIKLRQQDEPKVLKDEIPWKYVFISPVMIEIIGGPLASFVNQRFYRSEEHTSELQSR